MKYCLFLVIIVFTSFHCSGSKERYSDDITLLSQNTIASGDGSLEFKVPMSWDSIKVIKNSNFEFIITDREKRYTITLNELKVPYNIRELIENEGFESIQRINLEMLKQKYGDMLNIEYSALEKNTGQNRYYDYEYSSANNLIRGRVIIIDNGRKLYELIATGSSRLPLIKSSVDSLFSIQQTMLNNIKNK